MVGAATVGGLPGGPVRLAGGRPDSDPAYRRPDGTVDEDRAGVKRAELFNLIEELVQWENSNDPLIIGAARAEIARCVASRKLETGELKKDQKLPGGETVWDLIVKGHGDLKRLRSGHARLPEAESVNAFLAEYAPPVLDPFCGGGSIPLEAQRLGLRACASDLNPVAVLITKALIEIPPKFAGKPPVNPESRRQGTFVVKASSLQKQEHAARMAAPQWEGAAGLAEDVRYYGKWMRDEAEKRIGHLYPKVKITKEMAKDRPDLKPYVGEELTVIAWLWARTVASPNPAVGGAHVPLVRSFWLSTKKGKEAWVRPVIDRKTNTYRFEVRVGKPPSDFDPGTGTIGRKGGRCILTGAPMGFPHVRSEGQAGRMKERLMAIVAEGTRGRVYLPPLDEHARIAKSAKPVWKPDAELPNNPRDFKTPNYGMTTFADLFTNRQLTALVTFSDLVGEARAKVLADALGARASRPHSPVHDRGYLPHWEAGQRPQAVTFRLADSLPVALLEAWEAELKALPEGRRDARRRERMEDALDQGLGACILRRPEIARIVEDALLRFDGSRYQLHAWTIMPNHVHVLFTPLHDYSLSSILHSWKSFTAKQINRVLGTTGKVWQEEYFDRMIRDHAHWINSLAYIDANPVKADLCSSPEQWPFGSAAHGLDNPTKQHPAPDGIQERAGRPRSQDLPLDQGGTGPQAYADAVGVYLAFGVSKASNLWSSMCSWMGDRGALRETFARQAIPMVWDYAEANPFSESGGSIGMFMERIADTIACSPDALTGHCTQLDATASLDGIDAPTVSTDPPYYDNIGYADLSDYFYFWLRRSLSRVYPALFATLLTPKRQELVASPYRHGGDKEKAQRFFEDGLAKTFTKLRGAHDRHVPLTMYYAFKQAESEEGDEKEAPSGAVTASTGWETMLEGIVRSGFAVTGTWPMRTESPGRAVARGTNALASSIVLACRPRSSNAPLATRREFLNALKRELPDALRNLQRGSIAPVDLAQAAIGPGMAVFTRYAKVMETDGSAMTVRTALGLINQVLDGVLAEQEGEFDADTRWALAWFEQFGMEEGPFGVAETLSKAKNTAINGLVEAGIVMARAGKVRLLDRKELGSHASGARASHHLGARPSRPHQSVIE
ncbi:MAG: REP-associated tyrosine transposase [Phycisphaerae bacterium]